MILTPIKRFFRPNLNSPDSQTQYFSVVLWIFPLIVPFLIIIFKYILQGWYWGLMDDSLVLQAGPGMYKIFSKFFSAMFNFGQFRPMLALHVSIFYSLFEL